MGTEKERRVEKAGHSSRNVETHDLLQALLYSTSFFSPSRIQSQEGASVNMATEGQTGSQGLA